MQYESVLLQLQRATHATLQILAAELADLDLSGSDINALGNLSHHSGGTVSQLCTAIGVRPATLTGILDRLERRGLISRGNRPGDRRAVLIELTDAGVPVAARIRQSMRALEKRALAGLPSSAVSGARAVLRALAESAR